MTRYSKNKKGVGFFDTGFSIYPTYDYGGVSDTTTTGTPIVTQNWQQDSAGNWYDANVQQPISTPTNSTSTTTTNTTNTGSESLPVGAYSPQGQERSVLVDRGVWTVYLEGAKYIADVENNLIQATTGYKKIDIPGALQDTSYGGAPIVQGVQIRLDKKNGEWIFQLMGTPSNVPNFELSKALLAELQGIRYSYYNPFPIKNLYDATQWLANALFSENWQRPYQANDNPIAVSNDFTNDAEFQNTLIDSLQAAQKWEAEQQQKIIEQQAQNKLLEETQRLQFEKDMEQLRIQGELANQERIRALELERQRQIQIAQEAEAELLRQKAELAYLTNQQNTQLANDLAQQQYEREQVLRDEAFTTGTEDYINRDTAAVNTATTLYNKPADWTKVPTGTTTATGGRAEGEVVPTTEKGFLEKYKWWIIGGAIATVVLGGGAYAYNKSKAKPTGENAKKNAKKDK